MFWSSRPSPADREAILSAAGAADLRLVTDQEAGPPWYDHLYLGAPRPDGLMVEVVHSLTTATQGAPKESVDARQARTEAVPDLVWRYSTRQDVGVGTWVGQTLVSVGPAHHVRWRAVLTPNLNDLALTRTRADLPGVDHQVIALARMHRQPPEGSLNSSLLRCLREGNHSPQTRCIARQQSVGNVVS